MNTSLYLVEKNKTEEGYSIYWIYSNIKARRDRVQRENALKKVEDKLGDIITRANTRNLKTREQISKAIDETLTESSVKHLYHIKIGTVKESEKKADRKRTPY